MSGNSKKRSQSLKIPGTILAVAKFLEKVSPNLLTRFAARLFTGPLKHKTPKRELDMERKSVQSKLYVPALRKKVVVYQYGNAGSKILLVHGWSGRGTQLVRIADALLENGYSVVSFDAPAHGKSAGTTTLMPEFIAAILEIDRKYGPFDAAIGHSLGGMSLLNAVKRGLKLNRLVTIGSGDIVKDIMDDFVRKLNVDAKFSDLLRQHFEKSSEETMDSYSAYIAAREIDIPVLVIHDNDDDEVPVSSAYHIHKNLKKGELMLTRNLGHRKILGDPGVIRTTLKFIQNENNENKHLSDNARHLIADGVPGTAQK